MDTSTVVIVTGLALAAAAVLAVAVAVLVQLVRARRDLVRAGLPAGPRWVFWGAVLYLVLPADLLPDPVYLDDIGVLLLALRSTRGALGGRGGGGERRPEAGAPDDGSGPGTGRGWLPGRPGGRTARPGWGVAGRPSARSAAGGRSDRVPRKR
ncbi:DUF1232 domain-containing protein [Streptomyces sp. SHP 1-2]|nr:DUF1232 domain-containing protein [Streptomyces sp. SHP 1-2]